MVGGGATARRGSTQSAFDNTTQQQQQQQLLLLSSSSPQPSSRGSRIIRSAAILPGESDITGQESEDNLPVVKRASIRRLEDSGPQITVPTDRKNSRHSMGQDNVKSIDLIASPAAKQSSNVVTTATAEESSDDEYDEDDSGADESIPESEEFVIDSAAISRSLMDNLNSEPDGESDADDGASASDSPSSDSPSSSEDEYDSILHPSKHRTE
jgi:hypothetical protein